ncbi:MAG: hypothetical protein Q8O56_15370 [Solirubrobacteraceae bacterium]|nr:hypothetical protein [Solirubrobacteraceae bacterium]
MYDDDLIDVTVPGFAGDPRDAPDPPPGVRIHYAPELHPDDVVTMPGGLRVTSPARTLVDLAEVLPRGELRATFERAREIGLLDIDAVLASAARVEWRPSLAMLHDVIGEFAG